MINVKIITNIIKMFSSVAIRSSVVFVHHVSHHHFEGKRLALCLQNPLTFDCNARVVLSELRLHAIHVSHRIQAVQFHQDVQGQPIHETSRRRR